MVSELLWAGGKAFIVAVILTPILRDIFRSYNILDRPGQRKVHAHPIPRVGGIPIAIAYGLSLVSFSGSGFSLVSDGLPVWKLIPGAAMVFATGLVDDFFTLKPLYKLAGQIVAAGLVFWSGLRIETIADKALPGWLSLSLTVFWLLLATNAFNLIDGLDGLCAGVGLVATLALSAAALLHGNQQLAHATLPLAGALLGFLCYNLSPATVFLGDSGALLIGFLLGCYGMIWTTKTATMISMLVPLLALSVPLLDVSLAVMRRFLRNQPIFGADRSHIHHRLLDQGLTPRRAVLVLYVFAAGAAAFALLLSSPGIGRYRNLVFLIILGVIWLGIRQLGYKEFDAAGQMLWRGEFQRLLSDKLRLDRLAAALQQARTEDSWWSVLESAAKERGWIAVRWTSPRRTRELVLSPNEPAWTVSIPVGEYGTIQVDGSPEAGTALDLNVFAETVRDSLSAKRADWEELAVS
jgi:UDP-GlcNAc:undecaprenyl-phosphate GlcNAc-1-phosphate transferase